MKISIIFLILVIISITLIGAKSVNFEFPSNASYGVPFQVNLTLINYSEGVYDIKIDFYNSTNASERFSQIYNGSIWQTTYNYVNSAINTSMTNFSNFTINITELYNSTANITLKIRKSSTIDTYENYTLNITILSVNLTNSSNSTNLTCTSSYTCGSWGSCSSGHESKTCINASANCTNITQTETRTCSNSDDIELDFSWDEDDIISNKNFTIRYRSSIPRQVGLAGSSAMAILSSIIELN